MQNVDNKNPIVAIVGRPNVGKSTLFNRLIKERKSIVDDTPGVTRDRLYANIEWNGKDITLVDTGGLTDSLQSLEKEIAGEVKRQVYSAVEEADFVVFLVDGKSGVTGEDEKIASYFRKIKDKKKIFLAVNKIDTEKQLDFVHEFYSLGLGEPYPISALSGSSGLADILDEISSNSCGVDRNEEEDIRIAIVGKPNVGKSSILNTLLGEERSIVTPIAGTTRDSIDCKLKIDGKNFLLIDTAGLRRKSKVSTNIERYATTRAIAAIEKADIALLVVDATVTISDQDQKIASLIKKRNKASIILVNKWDLIEKENKKSNSFDQFKKDILTSLHFISYSKMLFTCKGIPRNAFTRENDLDSLWSTVDEVYSNYQKRVSTSKLNKIVEDIILLTSPPSKKGKQLRIYYVTQANIKPPEIVFFVNDSKLVNEQYQKFLEKEIRNKIDFSGSPIKMVFRNKSK